jgi:hypothetical protein
VSKIFDHLGLVAGMFEELEDGDWIDDLFEYGVTERFRDVTAHATEKLGLTSQFAHLDATSFSLEGIRLR